ncbi:hypothetical protein AL714_00970 [Clostridium botulinum]|nr:hypothetical protein CLB_2167 [Clostridium botulinum A str. ATCC 19397]ABS37356.1 hypothetical protein CLC_2150 [Clostridium botulinum A str. Hall]OPD32388.1 hypothetical protein AL711_09275 [Clostridium botulinum]CBZ04048.1 hypothetical protein H04402_02240 [Clostridium botulinum H04402 065]OPD34491.1 hypothetical protein AL713_03775 [Clostridium botulinum]
MFLYNFLIFNFSSINTALLLLHLVFKVKIQHLFLYHLPLQRTYIIHY